MLQSCHDLYREAFGGCPTLRPARDAALLKPLLQAQGEERVRAVWAHYLGSGDRLARTAGFDVPTFSRLFDGVALALDRAEQHAPPPPARGSEWEKARRGEERRRSAPPRCKHDAKELCPAARPDGPPIASDDCRHCEKAPSWIKRSVAARQTQETEERDEHREDGAGDGMPDGGGDGAGDAAAAGGDTAAR